jgi:hypothetical protein
MKKEIGTRMLDMAKETLENCEKDEDLRKKKRLSLEKVVLALKIC